MGRTLHYSLTGRYLSLSMLHYIKFLILSDSHRYPYPFLLKTYLPSPNSNDVSRFQSRYPKNSKKRTCIKYDQLIIVLFSAYKVNRVSLGCSGPDSIYEIASLTRVSLSHNMISYPSNTTLYTKSNNGIVPHCSLIN